MDGFGVVQPYFVNYLLAPPDILLEGQCQLNNRLLKIGIGFRQPVHDSLRTASTCLACPDFYHMTFAYSAVE